MTPTEIAEPAPAPEAVLELASAAVELGGRMIWSDVDLRIGRGEFVAILGPNGAGKSTLLQVFLGLIRLTAGSASVLGAEPGVRNAQIGYLPQRHAFDSSTRIRGIDLVRLGLDGNRWGLPMPGFGGDSRERVKQALALVGATGYAHRSIGQCSGGEQQRLLIAQTLVARPQMLFLDEPLDSLDLPNQTAVTALLERICRAESVAVLLVAHDVNPLLPYVDRVVYVAGGRVLSGAPEEVVTSAALSDLYGVPIEVLRASDGRMVVVGEPEAPAHHSDRHAH